MASFHTEFSLESVRQYMLMKDGQVTNHELVKHFKHWLTHPTQSEISRQKFKEYVNTLATIKQVHIKRTQNWVIDLKYHYDYTM